MKPLGRPRDPNRVRITSRRASGFAFVYRGWWYTQVGYGPGARKTTKLRYDAEDPDANVALVRSVLEARSIEHAKRQLGLLPPERENGSLVAGAVAPDRPATCGELWLRFEAARMKGSAAHREALFRQARRAFLDVHAALEHDEIAEILVTRNASLQLAEGTRRNYLIALRELFKYAVDRGWLQRNPMAVLGRLPRPSRVKIGPFEPWEVRALLGWFDIQAHSSARSGNRRRVDWRIYWRVFRLQALSGQRIEEVTLMRREDVTPDGFLIHGKGGEDRWFSTTIPDTLRTRAKRNPIARARVAWLTEIRVALDDLVANAATDGSLVSVHKQTLLDRLNDAKEACAMEPDNRMTHSFRKAAIAHMRDVLFFDREFRAELVGHDEEMQEKHYIINRTLREQADVMATILTKI